MNMAEEKKDVFARVRREVREKQEKEAERMRRFNELLGRENTDDEVRKRFNR